MDLPEENEFDLEYKRVKLLEASKKATKQPKAKCEWCGKTLPSIGKQRKNGRYFTKGSNHNNDWGGRRFHKKCFKEQLEYACYEDTKSYFTNFYT
jgi:hypothetical protein